MERQRRRGVAAIEFALWLPVILLMFGGIVDLSMYVALQHDVVQAARDGARYGSTVTAKADGTVADRPYIIGEATGFATKILNDGGLPCPSAACQVTGSWLKPHAYWLVNVRVEYAYEPLTGMITMPDSVAYEFQMMTQLQPQP